MKCVWMQGHEITFKHVVPCLLGDLVPERFVEGGFFVEGNNSLPSSRELGSGPAEIAMAARDNLSDV